jgi:ornithine cyclodeaminase/alanine dehydrogenase
MVVLFLNRADVAGLVEMDSMIEAVHQVHVDLATGAAVQPDRASVQIDGSDAAMIPMIAASARSRLGCVKVLLDCPGNQANGLPMQQSTILLVSMDNGVPQAYLHGGAIVLHRTAAASAVATRALSREDSHVLGFVGTGGQARTHLRAIAAVRRITQVNVWGRSPERAHAFAEEARELGMAASVLSSPREVVENCDILCTLTPSREPIVEGSWFQPGQHVNAVGAPPRDDHREIDTAGIKRARVIVDEFQTALNESGDVMIPVREGAIEVDHFRTDLGSVLTGATPGRRCAEEITLFDSVGLAIQDLAGASLVLDLARQRGVGTEVSLA